MTVFARLAGAVRITAFVAALFQATTLQAQTTATLGGSIVDSSGRALPGTQVTVRQPATGAVRSTVSGGDGRFVVAGISAGQYEVRAELSGFRPTSKTDITVTVGETLVLPPITLEVGGITEAVTVTSAGAIVNTATSELSYLVGAQVVASLPLNGRNYTDLALLQPGVIGYPSRDGGSVVAHGLGMSVNGQDYRSNVYLLDGTLLNDFTNGPSGSAAGTALGVETIQEFRVESNAYSAEYGRNFGGQVNVLTKSGTNTTRGSAYEFFRNDALDAANYFDVNGKPDFTRNQFGGSVGGPIVRDRLFYFVGYEALREDLGRTISSFVPDDNARLGLLPDGPVTIADAVRPYLNAIPRANGPAVGSGLATHTWTFNQTVDQHFFQGRLDHQLASGHQFFVRYTADDVEQFLPTDYPQFPRAFISTNQFATFEYRNALSSSTFHTARFGYSRTRVGQNVQANLESPLPPFVPGRDIMGSISIGGMQSFGAQTSANLRLAQNVYSGQYDLSHARGGHLLKVGGVVEQYRDFMTNPTFSLGIYTFASLRTFLQNTPLRFVGLGPTGDVDRDWPWTYFAAYAQDNYQLSRNLTVNLGLRYEGTTMPVDRGNRDSALPNIFTDRAATVGPLYQNPSKANISPRVGAAWDVFGDGSTSVRAGYGLYFNTNNQQNLIVTVTNPPATPRFVIPNPTFPSPPFERGVGNTIRPVQNDLEAPRIHVFNTSVQRSLPGSLIATVGYAGSRGKHLFRNTDINIPQPTLVNGRYFWAAGLPRPNTAFGTIELKSSDGESWYNALIMDLRRNWTRGLSAQASYTLSKIEDTTQASTFFSDATNGTTVAFPEFDPNYNKGPADWDARHNLVMNIVWDLPFARSTTGIAGALLRDWQITGISNMRSGQPLTVFVQNNWSRSQWSPSIAPVTGLDRPDLAPGRTPESAVIGDPAQWFDPTAFVLQPQGTLGNSPRGAFRGPNMRTVDVAAVKRLPFGSRARLDLRLEVFNIFNRANFGNPTLIAFAGASANEAPLATFGRIRSTVTSARQLQLGARLSF